MYVYQLREIDEEEDFDGDRYLGDLFGADEDFIYQEAMNMVPFGDEGER